MRRWLDGWCFRLAEGLAMRLPRRWHMRTCPYCIAADNYLKEQQRDR